MELDKKKIGSKVGSKIGLITIENNPDKFKLYKALGLDVFKNDTTKKSNSKRKGSSNTDGENDDK